MKILLLVICMIVQSYSFVNKVVDLSHWNNINFKLAKRDGILAVIHKATQGLNYVDPTYHKRSAEAAKDGFLWGAYHFGVGGQSGAAQADHFLKTVGNHTNVLLALDVEPNGDKTMDLAHAEDFVKRVVDKTGRYPLIYGSSSFLSTYTGQSEVLKQCGLWVAHYTEQDHPRLPKGKESWVFWQYTDGQRGGTPRTVKGIGPCDRDRFSGEEDDLLTKWPHF